MRLLADLGEGDLLLLLVDLVVASATSFAISASMAV